MNEIIIKKVDELKADPNQPRKKWNELDLRLLGETMKIHGMINPIEIDENNIIVTGESRWRAAKLVKIKEIPTILKKGLTPEIRLQRQYAENAARTPLSEEDQYRAIKTLVMNNQGRSKSKFNPRGITEDKGYRDLARSLGITHSWISQLIAHYEYLDKPETPKIIKEARKKGEISRKVVMEIAKLPDPKEQEDYAKNYLETKKAGIPKDSNRVAEDISKIKNGKKEIKKQFEKTTTEKMLDLTQAFDNLGDALKKFTKEKTFEKLTENQNEMLQRHIITAFKDEIMPNLKVIYSKGRFIFDLK